MKHTIFSAIVLLPMLTSFIAAGTAYEKWTTRKPATKAAPTVKDYDKLIADLKAGQEELKKERDALNRDNEKTTYVSLWALREVARTQMLSGFIWSGHGDSYGKWVCIYPKNDALWKAWSDAALELDRKEGRNLIDLNNLTTTTNGDLIILDKE